MFLGLITLRYLIDNVHPNNDENHCYYYLAMYKYQCKGVVTLIDTKVDRSGVGIYVDNFGIEEHYRFYTDSLASQVSVGDSIFKYKNSIYGYIKKYNGKVIYLSLLNKREECDVIPDVTKEEIIKSSGVNFK